MEKTKARRMRELLDQGIVVSPGIFDGYSARLVEKMGFKACSTTGAGLANSRLSQPDVGIMQMMENADGCRALAQSLSIPVMADADTGYGNPVNVRRTIRDYERAGVAGVHLEDQQWPKRCGHLSGKRVIPTAEMVAKLKSACDARQDKDFVIIARTDAIAVEGINAAFDRAEAYREAGADVLFVEAPVGVEQVKQVSERFKGVPLLYNMAASGKTPDLPADELGKLGFKLAIYPNWVILAAIPAMRHMLRELKRTGGVAGMRDKVATFKEFTDIAGLPEVQALEAQYGVPEDSRASL